ncbi:MAG TPA: thioredoxin domain-containing protein [Aestuariivirgaceae bacterium]|nr:thioredoxin domain-containing protein [Aestuariivirgaceae bacterium]
MDANATDNQLVREQSPYLLQHKDNPVHWLPWGKEAFSRAAQEDKPILLSVGYAACHWCHVMAHESFEDRETAELMNRNFINVKVDREERPEVDKIYMDALHRLGEQGGWPLTMFLRRTECPSGAALIFRQSLVMADPLSAMCLPK